MNSNRSTSRLVTAREPISTRELANTREPISARELINARGPVSTVSTGRSISSARTISSASIRRSVSTAGPLYTEVKVLSDNRKDTLVLRARKGGERVVIKIFLLNRVSSGSYFNEIRILRHLSRFPQIDFVQRLIATEEWSQAQLVGILSANNIPLSILEGRMKKHSKSESHKDNQDTNSTDSSNERQSTNNESYNPNELNDPNAPNELGTLVEPTYPVIITSYCGRDLFYSLYKTNEIGDIRFTTNISLIENIARAADILATRDLPILHSVAGVIHCDIKPENIAYSTTRNKCYFIDFGSACLDGENTSNNWNERTYPYYEPKFDTETERDEYAMGIVLYSIAHRGQLPKIKITKAAHKGDKDNENNSNLPLLEWNNHICDTQIGYDYCSYNLRLLD